ncbi:toxic anion resistance protein [Olsenella profusa]|uniref:Toxic anion resistance protein TelA n=1 Tax=Olsenella profusa F0195 TaxID=1125712 RepID=U2T6M7_9ACTN|nr:toxic anion resistance protein [Olsenella profusa]ERL08709.1 toxic anion resistance protein TelA [Olsenella profusa F0195]
MADGMQDLGMEAPEPQLEFGDLAPQAPEPSPITEPAPTDAAATLTSQEREQVSAFVEKIDVSDTAGVLAYGVGSQRKVSEFSERALSGVRGRDLGEVGDDVTSLIVTLKNFSPDQEEAKGIRSLFRKAKGSLDALKARYSEVEKNVRAIAEVLEGHQRTLIKDIALLDQLYALNEAYFKELTMYVVAGKEKLEQVRTGELATLQAKARESGLAEDAQAARDLAQKCDRFEKRVFDLELTRQVALQTAPQIRLVQSSDAVMAEKIQSTVVNTIPLWKNQMVIALGIEHATQAARAQREVADMTNQLLKRNADQLKVATVESAREAERGVVDIETLRHTNEQLISTLDEVARVQSEGRERRRQAEAELTKIEGELKAKLLEASQAS